MDKRKGNKILPHGWELSKRPLNYLKGGDNCPTCKDKLEFYLGPCSLGSLMHDGIFYRCRRCKTKGAVSVWVYGSLKLHEKTGIINEPSENTVKHKGK